MPPRFVPVTMGSPRFSTVEVQGLQVTDAWFPPGSVLAPHRHERPVLAVMLAGSFDLLFPGRVRECPPETISTEPLGERHGNRVGAAGARVLVLQPDPAREDVLRPCAHLLERVTHLRDGGVAASARRLTLELRQRDAAAPLAVESLALDVLATAARLCVPDDSSRRPPAWLARVRERLHDELVSPPTVTELARDAAVHPVHLARAFRAFYGRPVGVYARGLRLDWAADQLVGSRAPLAEIALHAGFADQSHFTRAFRRHTGTTPGRFRRRGHA